MEPGLDSRAEKKIICKGYYWDKWGYFNIDCVLDNTRALILYWSFFTYNTTVNILMYMPLCTYMHICGLGVASIS